MVRRLALVSCSAVLVVVSAPPATACDTSSWLQVPAAAGPGAVVTVRGGGFDEGPVALAWDRSTGQVLGEGTAGPDGALAVQVTIPSSASGRHKVLAVSPGAAESAADTHAWTDVVVVAPVAEPVSHRPAEDSSAAPPAPVAAAAPRDRLVAAGLLLVALATAVGARRRRPPRPVPVRGSSEQLDRELQLLCVGARDDRDR